MACVLDGLLSFLSENFSLAVAVSPAKVLTESIFLVLDCCV